MENSDAKQEIFDTLETSYGASNWILTDFKYLIGHRTLQRILEDANIETSVRGFKNKHGVDHGLTTAYNTLKLFRAIEEDFVKSDYVEDFPGLLEKEHVLFALLVAGYIHDAGRFYDPKMDHERYIADATDIIGSLEQAQLIFGSIGPDISGDIKRRIKELCLFHDQKYETSGKVEIALIKLADALDCCKSRVYQRTDLEEMGPEEKCKQIMINDERPERYFGSLYIDNVDIEWDDREKVTNISIYAKNYACSVPIKLILRILKNCENSIESVQEFARRIRVEVEVQDEKHRFTLYPERIIKTPEASVINDVFKFDLQNCEGDTIIENFFEIKNEKKVGKITSHPFLLEGGLAVKWEDLNVEAWKIENSESLQPLQILHKTSDNGGKIQTWAILLDLKEGEAIKIRQVCSWPRFFKTRNDFFSFEAHTPHSQYEIEVLFPKQMEGKLKAYYFVKDPEGDGIFRNPLPIEKKNGRPFLHLKHECILKTNWVINTSWSIV